MGYRVAMSGLYAVSSAPWTAGEAGAVYVFARDGEDWPGQAKLSASDAASGDWFGEALAISGDTIVVGAPRNGDAGNNSGAAYVFRRSGTSWTEEAKLTASDAAPGDTFGFSVAVDGDRVIVGAYLDNAKAGSTYVFERQEGSWVEIDKLAPTDLQPEDRFGDSLSISGDWAVISARGGGSGTTAPYLYHREASGWIQQARLLPVIPVTSGQVAISDNRVVLGVGLDDEAGTNAGAAYVFVRDNDIWDLEDKVIASGAGKYENFGYSVDIDNGTIVVGAYEERGAAYVYVPEPATVDMDIKPGSWPNPLNTKSKGVLPLAICGTADVDVTTIDPGTILLGREGFDQWLAPLRWSIEDVATPYDNGHPGGHDLDGDGLPDLALKFSTEELAALLGLGGQAGNTIPLTLTGTLTDEAGGLEFEGLDWIWVLRTGDANLDGFVDIQDFYILKANFAVGTGWSEGDFNDDGLVDIQDFAALKAQFGTGGAPVSALPEPATLAFLGASAGLLLKRRRRPKRS